jgi:hypothetical protein
MNSGLPSSCSAVTCIGSGFGLLDGGGKGPGDNLRAVPGHRHGRTARDHRPWRGETARRRLVVREVGRWPTLVLHSTTHLPLSWRLRRWQVTWTWAFVLSPGADGTATRLVFCWRACTHPWWLTAALTC